MSDLSILYAPGVPDEVLREFAGHEDGDVIAYEYDCAVLERKIRRGYRYTAVNRTTGRKLKFDDLSDFADETDMLNIFKTIRLSDIAGAGRLQADRPIGEKIGLAKAKEIITAMLDKVLPACKYNIDDEHKVLASRVLGAMTTHEMRLLEYDISDLNIVCSLISVIVAKRGRMNDLHARRAYPYMQYADMPRMPILVSVPDKNLRNRIVNEILPLLSNILYEYGIINEAINVVERKGHDNYVCFKKAEDYHSIMRHKNRHKKQCRELGKMLKGNYAIDLDEYPWLSAKGKAAISADGNCAEDCPNYSECKYVEHLNMAKSYDFDIQVCTHRYFIADTQKRAKGSQPLLPNYQALVIFDAHECLQAAETMYKVSISSSAISDIIDCVKTTIFHCRGLKKSASRFAVQLNNECKRFFERMVKNTIKNSNPDNAGVDLIVARYIKNICKIASDLLIALYREAFYIKAEELLLWVHNRFGADMTPIDISILKDSPVSEEDNLRVVVNKLCKAICSLDGINARVLTEKAKMQKKGFDDSNARRVFIRHNQNTEREAIRNADSVVHDVIGEQARKLLMLDYPTGKRSGQILQLARKVSQLMDDADAAARRWGYSYRFEMGDKWNCLYATPNKVGTILFAEHRLKSIPTILFPGDIPVSTDIDEFKWMHRISTQQNYDVTVTLAEGEMTEFAAALEILQKIPTMSTKELLQL